ncbi:unnamed protein product [Pelagomonas calceolata]|uniref:Uncharacterized protein n=1 Tax=Pelagomonas calceolata TaxID=35677 RepID=A0A8J2SBY5_9STRA|nr:unnamed protein product [Pelagomonas calceolata]|mmetsp:Transcript_8915/g.25695  ORF Transcript_8915/g.25695 Transcript_8915/m.25695 type:complete len:1010 (-) Transcript_8915:39-3068(-)
MVDAVPTTREALLDRIERRAPQQRWIVADRNELGPYFSLCHLIDVPLETVRALLGPDDWFRAETTSQPNQWMFRVARADGLRLACLGNFQHVVWIYIDHSGAAPLTQPGHMIDKSNPLRSGWAALQADERDALRARIVDEPVRYGVDPPRRGWPARAAPPPPQPQSRRQSTRRSVGAPRRSSTFDASAPPPLPSVRKRAVPPDKLPKRKQPRSRDAVDVAPAPTPSPAPAPTPAPNDEGARGAKRVLSPPRNTSTGLLNTSTQTTASGCLFAENARLREENRRIFELSSQAAERSAMLEARASRDDALVADLTARLASTALEDDAAAAALPSGLLDASRELGRRIAAANGRDARREAFAALYVAVTEKNRKNGMLLREVGNANLGARPEDLTELKRFVTSISKREMGALKGAMGRRYKVLKARNRRVGVGAYVEERGELVSLDWKADLAMKKRYAPQFYTILEAATQAPSWVAEQRSAEAKLAKGKAHKDWHRRTLLSGRALKAFVSRRREKKEDGLAYLFDFIVNMHTNGAHEILTPLHLYLALERTSHGQSHESQGHDSHFSVAASYRTTYRLRRLMSDAYVATFPDRLNEMLDASPAISERLGAARTLQRWRHRRALAASSKSIVRQVAAAVKLQSLVRKRQSDASTRARVLYASLPADLARRVAGRRIARVIITKHDNYATNTSKTARYIKSKGNLRAVSTATGTICPPYENDLAPPSEREVPINTPYDGASVRRFWREHGSKCVMQKAHGSEFPCVLDVSKIGLVTRADVGPPNRAEHRLHDNKILPQIEMVSSSLKDHVLKFLLRYKEWTSGRIFESIWVWAVDTEFVLHNARTLEMQKPPLPFKAPSQKRTPAIKSQKLTAEKRCPKINVDLVGRVVERVYRTQIFQDDGSKVNKDVAYRGVVLRVYGADEDDAAAAELYEQKKTWYKIAQKLRERVAVPVEAECLSTVRDTREAAKPSSRWIKMDWGPGNVQAGDDLFLMQRAAYDVRDTATGVWRVFKER